MKKTAAPFGFFLLFCPTFTRYGTYSFFRLIPDFSLFAFHALSPRTPSPPRENTQSLRAKDTSRRIRLKKQVPLSQLKSQFSIFPPLPKTIVSPNKNAFFVLNNRRKNLFFEFDAPTHYSPKSKSSYKKTKAYKQKNSPDESSFVERISCFYSVRKRYFALALTKPPPPS